MRERRRTAARSGAGEESRRRTTRSRRTVRTEGRGALLLGAGALGLGLIVVIVALATRSGPATRPSRPKAPRKSLEELTPHDTTPTPAPTAARVHPVRPLVPEPPSFYEKLLDRRLWEEAKGYAREGEKIWALLKAGKVPSGMTREQARRRAQELFARALDKANEFLEPVESRYRKEAAALLERYDAVMLRWQRKQRSLVYGFRR